MTLLITKMLLPNSKYSLKCPNAMDPIGVTVHETGNFATAMSEISYMIGNNTSTSYHFAVDETRAVQGLPLTRNGFHSSDGSRGTGNAKTIGVEHCYNWNGKATTKHDPKYNALYQKALSNGIELIAQLFIDHPKWGTPEAGKNIWRHYDHSKKNCPQRMIEEGYWNTYVARVKARYLELKGGKTVVVKSLASNPDKEGRSTKFKRGDKVKLSPSAKKWRGSSSFGLDSFKATYEVDWNNVDGTIYISPIGADWGGNVLESDIENFRNNNIMKDDIIILRPQATHWFGGSKVSDGMKKTEYSVRERINGNTLYIDNGTFRGIIYDWDAIKK